MRKRYFVLSCYGKDAYIFGVPIKSSKRRIEKVLGRGSYPINGVPLTQAEFDELRRDALAGVEVGWYPGFEYMLEGPIVLPEK